MITIERESFLRALKTGSASSSNNRALPIYGYVKVEINNRIMTISSFNGETFISKTAEIVDGQDFSFCVEPVGLNKFLSSIKDSVLTLEIANETLNIKHKKGSIQLPILSADEFPTTERDEYNNGEVVMQSHIMNRWLSISEAFSAKDQMRPALMGMYLSIYNNEVNICSTDAHKLFFDKANIEYVGEEIKTIIPTSSFTAIKEVLNVDEEICVSVGKSSVQFTAKDIKVICRVIDATYPNFKAIIPTSSSIRVELSTEEILDSIKRAIISEDKVRNGVKLSFEDASLSIECNDKEIGKKSIEFVPIEKTGDNLIIGVNSKNFNIALNAISSKELTLKMTESKKAIILSDKLFTDTVILVMPMLL